MIPMQIPQTLVAVLAAFIAIVGCSEEKSPEKTNKGGSSNSAAHTPINLQPKANHPLNRPLPRGQGNNLADLPTGKQTLAGVAFEIGPKYLHLGSQAVPGMPTKVEGIAVDQTAKRLHFLHAASNSGIHKNDGSGQPDGSMIGKYVIKYEDGSVVDIAILYGSHLRDWWNWDKSKPTSDAKLAWEGTNSYAERFKIKVRLFVMSWDNPTPGKKIASIDFESSNKQSAPMLVAVTAER